MFTQLQGFGYRGVENPLEETQLNTRGVSMMLPEEFCASMELDKLGRARSARCFLDRMTVCLLYCSNWDASENESREFTGINWTSARQTAVDFQVVWHQGT